MEITGISSEEVIKGIRDELDKNLNLTLSRHNNFSELMEYIDLLNYFRENLKDYDQSIILDEVIYNLLCSINIAVTGMYRVANLCLRSTIELGITFIFFCDNNYKYLLWKKNNFDMTWANIMDKDNGIISKKYLNLFCREGNIENLINDVVSMYRETSEYVHGKYDFMHSVKGRLIKYNAEAFEEWKLYFKNIANILCTLFTIRFNKEVQEFDDAKKEFCEYIIGLRKIEVY